MMSAMRDTTLLLAYVSGRSSGVPPWPVTEKIFPSRSVYSSVFSFDYAPRMGTAASNLSGVRLIADSDMLPP